jgi:hypothetical protein
VRLKETAKVSKRQKGTISWGDYKRESGRVLKKTALVRKCKNHFIKNNYGILL